MEATHTRTPAKRAAEAPSNLRARLVQAGLALVERSGASGISLREVARRSRVSHMAPYSHFSNKFELLSAIAAAGFEMFEKQLVLAAVEAGDSPREQMLQTGIAYVAFALEHPQLLGLMFGGRIPPRKHSQELRSARGRTFVFITDIVARGIASGHFKPVDPGIAAFAAWSIVHGYAQLALGQETQDKLGVSNDQLLANTAAVIRNLIEGLNAR